MEHFGERWGDIARNGAFLMNLLYGINLQISSFNGLGQCEWTRSRKSTIYRFYIFSSGWGITYFRQITFMLVGIEIIDVRKICVELIPGYVFLLNLFGFSQMTMMENLLVIWIWWINHLWPCLCSGYGQCIKLRLRASNGRMGQLYLCPFKDDRLLL